MFYYAHVVSLQPTCVMYSIIIALLCCTHIAHSTVYTVCVDISVCSVIMDKYQEQPHLVDPFIGQFISSSQCMLAVSLRHPLPLILEEFIQSLFVYVRDPSTPPMLFHQAFKYLYFMTKVVKLL